MILWQIKERNFNMNGVLILAHGSKRQETERTLNSLIEKVKQKVDENLIYPAYLQFSEQNLEKGIEYLVDNGAKNIKIVPLFLFNGVHVTQDIPNELDEIMGRYPGVTVKMSRHLGDDDRIADIIADRISSIR
ncbi:MAG: sirohydrochlorin chelatase [Candidatus Humimicrobiaceae bacterium]